MVVSSEACCPKCFVQNQFSIKLTAKGSSGGFREFSCPYCQRYYVENEDGFLAVKEKLAPQAVQAPRIAMP